MADTATDVVVMRADERYRYEIITDDQLAGFTAYVDRDGQRIFYHTEIGETFGGRGLGRTLVSRALADACDAGMRVVPVCRFVKKYLENHHGTADIVDAVTPDALAAVREQTR